MQYEAEEDWDLELENESGVANSVIGAKSGTIGIGKMSGGTTGAGSGSKFAFHQNESRHERVRNEFTECGDRNSRYSSNQGNLEHSKHGHTRNKQMNAACASNYDDGHYYDPVHGQSQKAQLVTSITIATRNVGKLIGRGGSSIRELQDQSGAKIKINSSDLHETSVDIFGPDDCRIKAKELVESFLEPSRNREHNEHVIHYKERKEDVELQRPRINWSKIKEDKAEYDAVKWADYPSIKKNFYFEDTNTANVPPQDVVNFRRLNNNIVVNDMSDTTERKIPNPVKTFEQAFAHYPCFLVK